MNCQQPVAVSGCGLAYWGRGLVARSLTSLMLWLLLSVGRTTAWLDGSSSHAMDLIADERTNEVCPNGPPAQTLAEVLATVFNEEFGLGGWGMYVRLVPTIQVISHWRGSEGGWILLLCLDAADTLGR